MHGLRFVWALVGAVAVFGVLGCGSGATGTGATSVKPSIQLTADPQPYDVTQHPSLVLSWTSTDATGVDSSSFGATAVDGSKTIGTITGTTTYSLTLHGAGGSATEYCTVSVLGTTPDKNQTLLGTWQVTAARTRALQYTTVYTLTTNSLTQYDLDANNKPTNEVDYTSANATVVYDGTAHVLSITDANHTTPLRYAVNGLGRLLENATTDEGQWRDTGAVRP